MPVEDIQMTRRVMREIAKRNSIDATMVNIRAIHGVVYISGRVRSMRGSVGVSLPDEMHIVQMNCKRINGVRDVVLEVMY